jgi:succinate-semialdehyde dehydrogenase / glutarate-semialdehyde dehydrogenase
VESEKTFQKRLDASLELAEGIEHRKEDLAEAAAADAGFPVRISLLEADLAIDYLKTLEEEVEGVRDGHPYGTVAAIFPYDAPVVMLGRLGGSALLTGNRLRFSFSSWTPRVARVLSEISRSVESFEAILGQNNRAFGGQCVSDDTVRVLFISGSSEVGEIYRRHYRAFDKLFFAGPGGMPAAIVYPDADPEQASRFIARRAFINGGQYCTTLKKALIHSSLYEEVRKGILESVQRLKVGNPLEVDTDIGPIRVERTRKIIEHALAQCRGASLLTGGIDGEWVHPLVLEMEEIPDMELFGPFLALKSFEDPEEAVQELITSRYGFLLAYLGTPSAAAISAFHDHFGMVYANPDFLFTPLRIPFGGKKVSGWIIDNRHGRCLEKDGAFIYSRELCVR